MSANEEANQKWFMYSKFWSRYHEMQGDSAGGKTILSNYCFANRNEEIVEVQKADSTLKQYFKRNAVLDNGVELLFKENESCICHKGRLVLPKTIKSAIYWKGMKRPSDPKWSHARLAKWITYTKVWEPYHLKSWLALHGRLFVST